MKARYVRISTASQNIERQLTKKHPNESLFIDVISGATAFKTREKAKDLIEQIKDGKINYITVHSIDRLGRNLFDILSTLELLEQYGVILKVDNLGIERIGGFFEAELYLLTNKFKKL